MTLLLIALGLGSLAYLTCWVDAILDSRGTYVLLEVFGHEFVIGDLRLFAEERAAEIAKAKGRHPAGRGR